MPRPPHQRNVSGPPPCGCFKPAGVPAAALDEVILTVDEYEALRLADYEGLYQADVAAAMGVSRPTVGRMLQEAHRKVAEALVYGKSIRIEGGHYVTADVRAFVCRACGHAWQLPYGGGRPPACPACGAPEIHRTDAGRGRGQAADGTIPDPGATASDPGFQGGRGRGGRGGRRHRGGRRT